MGTYGKLTSDRETVTATNLNAEYDYFIIALVNILPSDAKYIDEDSIYDNIDLEDNDPISAQVETLDDVREAAKAVVRRWLRRNGLLSCITLIESLEVGDDYLADIEILDINDLESIRITDMLAPVYANDPRVLGDIYQGADYNFGRYGEDIINSMIEQGRAWIDTGTYYPFPVDRVQNVYGNMYTASDRSYTSITVQSRLPSSVIGYEQSVQATGAERFKLKSDSQSLINLGSSYASGVNLLEAASKFSFSTSLFGNTGSNYKPMSNTGQEFQEMSVPDQGTNSLVVGQFGKSILKGFGSSSNMQVQQFSATGKFKKISATFNKILPVSKTGLVGNSLTNEIQEQQTATVSTLINSNGEVTNIDTNVNSEELVYNGIIKLRHSPRSSISRPLRISKLSYNSSTSTGTTMSTELFTDSNTGSGFMKLGSLGTETFEDEGYDSWCVGAGTSLFTMNIDDDIGYNGFAAGTAYAYGDIEEFDDGWTEGASPYSRKQDNSEYQEDLSSQTNGSRTTFSTEYNFMEGSLRVYWNGQAQIEGNTFTVSDNLKSFTTTFTPSTVDALEVVYQRFYKSADTQFDYSKNTLRVLRKDIG